MDRVKQTMRGIGFSNAFYTNWWHEHPSRDEIYGLLFKDLRPTILRFRNAFELEETSARDIANDLTFFWAARDSLGYEPTVLLTAWSPPTGLKKNGLLFADQPGAVLKKDGNGWFMYRQWADWWVRSIKHYKKLGLNPDWISLQNEPDFAAPHMGCLFGAAESFDVPGYYRAGDELHARMRDDPALDPPPRMIGPECYKMDAYIADFPYAGGAGKYHALANHLYASGVKTDPYSFNEALGNIRTVAAQKQVTDIFMSEYAKLGDHQYQDPLRLGIVMHNSFTIGDCTAYLHWDGVWARNVDKAKTPGVEQEGTLILVDDPFRGDDRAHWRNDKGYTVLQSFWWFMHFSKFIRPGYRRVQVDIDITDVLASAWTGPNGQMTLIFINTGRAQAYCTIKDMPDWMATQRNDVNYSTLDQGFTYIGQLKGDHISLLPRSITSVFSYKLAS